MQTTERGDSESGGATIVVRTSPFPLHFFLGLVLAGVSWTVSWTEWTPLAHHSFFPLWLGYVLIVDGMVVKRTSTSLLTRSPARFAALFGASIPLWWLFEVLNARLGNWSYELPHEYSWLAYHAEASLAFSTVVPALFGTAELFRSFHFVQKYERWKRLRPGMTGWAIFCGSGAIMLALVLALPDIFFPLVWIGLFFLVDPIVYWLRGRSIAGEVEQGRWSLVLSLFLAGLTCGFFWEFWNVYAMPKWTYEIPFAEWIHIFEMPILGYGGYLPFALETFSLVMLINRFTGLWPDTFLFPPREAVRYLPEQRPEVPSGGIVS